MPENYGLFQPTALLIPLKQLLDPRHWPLLNREVFGPIQIVAFYEDQDIDQVINYLNGHENHLTAGIVSNDVLFINRILRNTVNGVTYVGKKAKTTGAPQNYWFGPSNDPRASGIATMESVLGLWTCHREIV